MDDDRIARIDALLSLSDAELRAELRARLEPTRVGRALAWLAVQPDRELEELGLSPSDDERLEMIAWTLELARRCGPRP